MTPEHAHTNRLIDETSPYLLQHAHNPVDWYPWGDDALQKARRNDKPIFLSIGYSACHWCHVMERESFENETIAGALNDHFVPIKVDREERPDLDNLYMNAVQVMTGQGGWPMSVWLTPELEPFYAGTYFPPEDRYGRPGFSSVIDQVADAWQDDRDTVEQVGERIRAKLAAMEDAGQPARALTREPVDRAFGQLDDTFDADHGGFGDAPKFPPTQQLRLLLHVWGDLNADDDRRQRAVEMVETTLVHMASGGMYDQLGGGFHRYSVDQKWLIPHFEKMLYDNALLAEVYVEAWQATGRDFYRRIATETLDYVLAEMTGESTGAGRPFYSTQDADTDGHEGRFFVWTPDELADALGADDGLRAAEYWGVTDAGNFEDGLCALNRLAAVDDRGIEAAFEPRPAHIDDLRQRLLETRRGRSAPGTDTKVLAAWNAMMISALARAGWAFEMPRYISAAEDAADFILADMIDGELDDDFQLMRTFKDGRARLPGYLDDFAHLGAALIDLFEATGDRHRLAQAEAIVDRMVQLFADDDKGGFYSTGEHHRDLIVRQKQSHDGATPSGNAIALTDCLRLAELRGRDDLRQRAAEGLRAFFGQMTKIPTGMAEMIQALDFQVEGPAQIVVVVPDGADAKAIDDVLRTSFVPNAVRARIELAAADADTWAGAVPLSRARTPVDDQPTVYVCFEGACQRPITDADALADLLG